MHIDNEFRPIALIDTPRKMQERLKTLNREMDYYFHC